MSENLNEADGKHIVIQDGKRVTAPMDTKEAAEAEALRRNKLAESSGLPETKRASVKQNILG